LERKLKKLGIFWKKRRKEVWNIYLFSVRKNSPLLQNQKFKKKKKENTGLRPPSIYICG